MIVLTTGPASLARLMRRDGRSDRPRPHPAAAPGAESRTEPAQVRRVGRPPGF